MKIKNIRIKGVSTAFQGKDVRVNVEDLGEGIFAIVGDNGSGKTTLMEAMGPASLYRRFPSYGETFASHVPPGEREAVVELEFELGGVEYRTVLQADPRFGGGRGKTEAFLYKARWEDGVTSSAGPSWTPIAGPLVKDYDAAIGNLFPSEAAFLAGPFACQGGDGSFFSLERKGRRDLFAEYLQIAEYQVLAEKSKAIADGLEMDAAGAGGLATVGEMEVKRGRGVEVTAELEASRKEIATLKVRRDTATTTLAETTDRLLVAREDLAVGKVERDVAAERNVEIDRTEAGLKEKRDGLKETIAGLVVLAEKKDLIEGAETELEVSSERAKKVAVEEMGIMADVGTFKEERVELKSAIEAMDAKIEELNEEVLLAKEAVGFVRDAGDVSGTLEKARVSLASVEDAKAKVEGAVPAARAKAIADTATLIRRDEIGIERSGLMRQKEAFEGLEDPTAEMCERCPLAVDAMLGFNREEVLLTELDGLPAVEEGKAGRVLSEVEKSVKDAGVVILATTTQIAGLETKEAEVLREWKTAERLPSIEAGLGWNLQGVQAKRSRFTVVQATIVRIEKALISARIEKASLAKVIEDKTEILKAREEILQAEGSLISLRTEVAGIESSLAEFGERIGSPDLSEIEWRIATTRKDLENLGAKIGEVDQEIVWAGDQRARLQAEKERIETEAGDEVFASLEKRVADGIREVAEWRILAKALGREGVQALKIDAAGPEVSGIANDLLQSCGWGRFQISLVTSSAKKDGGMKEVFEVRILDALADREARRGSGGEMVIIDESLRLALSIFNARRSGVSIETLWRDETVGALSSANASRYLEMLRRAREVGGFGAVYFVAHQREVWEQADGRIEIGPEGITVTR